MLKRFIDISFVLCFQAISFFAVGQDRNTTLEGTYQGDNLYVQNPYSSNTNNFCVSEVLINGKPMESDQLNSSAFEIRMGNLTIGDYVKIELKHDITCKPRVLNANTLRSKSTFELVSIKVEGNTLKWTTKNESNYEPFVVERFKNSKWVPIDTIVGKGPDGFNNYSLEVVHYSGRNRYRVKQKDLQQGRWKFAMPVEYFNEREPITFYPKRVSKEINFTDRAEYEIYDSFGSLVKKGIAETVDLSDIEPGIYYINLDNVTEKFLKK